MSDPLVPIEEFAKAMGVDPRALAKEYAKMEERELAVLNRGLNRESTRKAKQYLPLGRNEGGGRVAASIPEALFWNLWNRKGFGMKQRLADQDLKEVLKAFPQCRTETVSGKITSGFGGRGGRWGTKRPGVKFDTNVKFAT